MKIILDTLLKNYQKWSVLPYVVIGIGKNKQYDLAIKEIEKWVSKNISKLETGMSVYKASNSGRDLDKFAKMLGTDSDEIIRFINSQWDDIESEL